MKRHPYLPKDAGYMKTFTVDTKDRLSGIAHGTGWIWWTEEQTEKKENSKRIKRELRAEPRKLMLSGKLQKNG